MPLVGSPPHPAKRGKGLMQRSPSGSSHLLPTLPFNTPFQTNAHQQQQQRSPSSSSHLLPSMPFQTPFQTQQQQPEQQHLPETQQQENVLGPAWHARGLKRRSSSGAAAEQGGGAPAAPAARTSSCSQVWEGLGDGGAVATLARSSSAAAVN